ncbi:alpha/beta hydrolase [Streptomyces albiaxialis]|uniref:Alpha/beta hydrolase n=1 Tax=Streptomyces albiaxialis TaxID=329523 RepID=A0ABP5H6T5_9ACTN
MSTRGWITPAARTGEQPLAGGRVLGWAEWGPRDGTPVLFSPGAATSRDLGFGPDAVAALGVRLIALDRPGLGASTPAPGRTFADFAEDVREFAARRGLGRPAMVGNSQGAPFALACAAAQGVVGALAVVSGADEIAHPAFAAGLPEGLARLVRLSAEDPDAAEKEFAGFTPQAMWDMVTAHSPARDLAVYQEPGFAVAYRAAMERAFARGPEGYARDTVLAMGRWEIDLADIDVPVDLWYGDEDTSHSPDQGVTLTGRVPGAVHHLVPGAGGALLWTHAGDVLRVLLERHAA